MFELVELDDLLVPRPRSTTGRALASISLRRTFESCKGLAASPRSPEEEALREALDSRLPGDPHAIAHAVAKPFVGVPLRRGLVDSRERPAAIDRLLVSLGDKEGTIEGTDVAAYGKILIRAGDSLLCRAVGIEGEAGELESLSPLREAIEKLRLLSPAMHDDLNRFVSTLLVTEERELTATSIGVGTLPRSGSVDELFEALVRSLVQSKIFALVEGRTHDASLLRIAIDEGGDFALATLLGRSFSAKERKLPAADPLHFVFEELARG